MDAEPVGAGSHNPMVHRDTYTCTHLCCFNLGKNRFE
jgi:hypothetical protein